MPLSILFVFAIFYADTINYETGVGHNDVMSSPHALIHPDKMKTDPGVFTSVPCGQQRSSSGSIDGEASCMYIFTPTTLSTIQQLGSIGFDLC